MGGLCSASVRVNEGWRGRCWGGDVGEHCKLEGGSVG